ncbi:hypothetical protein P3X46_002787 [Hevea brasiliensis]|uniref:Protein CHUP1, chloroplastic n=1 Tax=Hevea brasiliensis TaxID=3981 RepID=A0ABQ9N6D7_HEVBR|nr:protein CHUP1, chloroplastic [Hevea brasiliensis]KAJ9187318.1 hypothetical protein P3X46_002787 [Hevea brasiliensis]
MQVTLDRKLFELYSLKEQQSYIAQLRKNLEEKMKEMDMLNITFNSLYNKINHLQKEIKEEVSAEKQVKVAKEMIEKIERKMNANESHLKVQLMMLQEKVSGFQRDEFSYRDTAIVERMKALKDVELEYYEMRRKNKELELEKRELAVKLVTAQARKTSLSNLTESKSITKIEEEVTTLKLHNEYLWNQVERLQKNRFSMVEELVYQRWLNTCLRYEIQNYGRSPSKWDLISKNPNQKPHEKSKQLLLDDSNSSHHSSTESDKNDSTSTTESSSSSQRKYKESFVY